MRLLAKLASMLAEPAETQDSVKPLRLAARPVPVRYKVLMVGGVPAVVDVHDADTFRMVLVCDGESGLGQWPWLRLSGCNAPEINSVAGELAQQWVVEKLGNSERIEVELAGWSFDRRIARVWVDGADLSVLLIESGHAVSWARPK